MTKEKVTKQIIIKPSLSIGKISKIMQDAGLPPPETLIQNEYTFSSSAEKIYHLLLWHEQNRNKRKSVYPETKELSNELTLLQNKLVEIIAVVKNIKGSFTYVDFELDHGQVIAVNWQSATEKLAKKIEKEINDCNNVKYKPGRKEERTKKMRVSLIGSLIRIFEEETGRNFLVKYDYYRDAERREFDKSGMKFLKGIMNLAAPTLTEDNLRKDIAQALDKFF